MKKKIFILLMIAVYSCLTISAQEQKGQSFLTVSEMMELSKPENLEGVKAAVEKRGYKFRGGKSTVMRTFFKGVTMDHMNRVTSVSDTKSSSVISYSSDDGTLSVDVFSEENVNYLKKQIEEAGFTLTSDSEALTRYTKKGTIASFTIMKYQAAGKQAYSVSYSE